MVHGVKGGRVFEALRHHWPEYLMEAAGLGIFMIFAGVFTTLMEHPSSPLCRAVPSELMRHSFIGLAMGLTAIGLIYSPWGQQSGAHFNPAVTLTFLRLGKAKPWDALFYVLVQFMGGLAGVLLISAVLQDLFRRPPVSFVATLPHSWLKWPGVLSFEKEAERGARLDSFDRLTGIFGTNVRERATSW